MTAEVLLLGGGYVSVWAARALLRSGADLRVTLVSEAPCHAFHGWTAEVLTGHVAPEHARVPLEQLVPGARVVHGRAVRVDHDDRAVAVRLDEPGAGPTERVLRYDELVIGTGSHDATERVAGLADHGWSIKGDGALAALTAHLTDVVARAAATGDEAERRRLLTVVVAGGGYAGAEAAAAVARRQREAAAAHPRLTGARPRVLLVTGGRHLVPSLRSRFARAADYLQEQVRAAGVEVVLGTRVQAVVRDCAALDDGTLVPTATVIGATGQVPVELAGTERLPRDASRRLVTDRELRVVPGLWAGGDAAAVPHPSGSGPCPADALWAIHHGTHIGRNVARTVQGRRLLPFRFPGLGQAASTGTGRAAAELYGVQLVGWPAWLARWGFFHWFMPSRRVALAAARQWFSPRRAPVATGSSRAVVVAPAHPPVREPV